MGGINLRYLNIQLCPIATHSPLQTLSADCGNKSSIYADLYFEQLNKLNILVTFWKRRKCFSQDRAQETHWNLGAEKRGTVS